jgi:hypothetical protein
VFSLETSSRFSPSWSFCLTTLNQDGKWRSLHFFIRSWFVIATTFSNLTLYM